MGIVHHNLVFVLLLYGVHTTCGCSGAAAHGHKGGLCFFYTCSWRVANFGSPRVACGGPTPPPEQWGCAHRCRRGACHIPGRLRGRLSEGPGRAARGGPAPKGSIALEEEEDPRRRGLPAPPLLLPLDTNSHGNRMERAYGAGWQQRALWERYWSSIGSFKQSRRFKRRGPRFSELTPHVALHYVQIAKEERLGRAIRWFEATQGACFDGLVATGQWTDPNDRVEGVLPGGGQVVVTDHGSMGVSYLEKI
eukprot:COSAG01_NODE_123_length_25210_cov_348.799434_6_plen_250_part_00